MNGQKFQLLYSDPAWNFEPWDAQGANSRAPDYVCMPLKEMMCLPVHDWAEDNSLLAMWVYDPMLPEAFSLAAAWGFKFVTVLFRWLKTTEHPGQLALFPLELPTTPMGLGYHTRHGGCEEVWLFKRGRGLPVMCHDIRTEFYALVREHSRKPDCVNEKLELLYGNVSRIEMFTRTRRPNWTPWGNEIDKFMTAL